MWSIVVLHKVMPNHLTEIPILPNIKGAFGNIVVNISI
jgi:hypothetical protein